MLLRVGVFALIAALGYYFVFPIIIAFIGAPVLVISTLGTFAAAAVANTLALRIYERGNLADIGLGWTAASRRNLSFGLLGGIGAAIIVIVLPLILRVADFVAVPNEHFRWPSLVFVSILLLFGAVGEEMLFRGYGFQVLVKGIGAFATILPVAVLFGLAHSQNPDFGPLALFNTILWGVVLGYAYLRSGDLWLPIGLHFGWNWALPLLGANLSGFTMDVTGYAMHWKTGGVLSGGAYGPEGGLLTTAITVALFFYLMKAPIQHQEVSVPEEAV
ncbi:MAG: CPBP family intramembrane metalloprotease [Bryobacterales bacterium]|nr:CPBP family intramembrane metalloprotease [Bryobacterales bacterium]